MFEAECLQLARVCLAEMSGHGKEDLASTQRTCFLCCFSRSVGQTIVKKCTDVDRCHSSLFLCKNELGDLILQLI